jgi:elongation factor P
MLDFSDIKLGKVIIFNNQPCVVIRCDFSKVTKLKPVKKCIMKSLTTGNNLNYTYKSGESVEEADLKREAATFMYKTDDQLSFMLTDSYETIEISDEMLSDKIGYLKEGLDVFINYFNDNPISVDMPIKIPFEVTQTADDVAKGNTSGGVLKPAILETGREIMVPAFIKTGEKILVNTVEDEYVERYLGK